MGLLKRRYFSSWVEGLDLKIYISCTLAIAHGVYRKCVSQS